MTEEKKQEKPNSGIYRKFTKAEINELKIISYTGPIHMIRSHRGMVHAVNELRGEKLLGFDTETRPSFKKGVSYHPSLLQIAGANDVYIFRLPDLGKPEQLFELLADPQITKTGVAVGRDIVELKQILKFDPEGFIDLGTCAREHELHHHGLRGLAALFLKRRISKGAQLTNWAQPRLSKKALVYAATDAWIGRKIYNAMKKHGCLKPKKQPTLPGM